MSLENDYIYLDYNATTPLAKEVVESISNSLQHWGNPSSKNPAGEKAKQLLVESREKVASCINGNEKNIIFTSGGTEANNWVIQSSLKLFKQTEKGIPDVITTDVEHDSIIVPLKKLEEEGEINLILLKIDHKSGELEIEDLSSKITPQTCLVSVMWANNETGTIMPIKRISEIIKNREKELKKRIYFHTDAAQAVGKVPVDVVDTEVDFLTIVGHKFYGPKIGALYVKDLENEAIIPLFYGGGQEFGWRSGTENIPMIVGLGSACSLVHENLEKYSMNMEKTRNYLKKMLKKTFGDKNLSFNCKSPKCIPNTCNVSINIKGCKGYKILEGLKRFYCSTGSACHSNCEEPSKILLKFGIDRNVAMNALRISTGRDTTLEDIDVAVFDLLRVVQTLQNQ